jgi:hypothetical protein
MQFSLKEPIEIGFYGLIVARAGDQHEPAEVIGQLDGADADNLVLGRGIRKAGGLRGERPMKLTESLPGSLPTQDMTF